MAITTRIKKEKGGRRVNPIKKETGRPQVILYEDNTTSQNILILLNAVCEARGIDPKAPGKKGPICDEMLNISNNLSKAKAKEAKAIAKKAKASVEADKTIRGLLRKMKKEDAAEMKKIKKE